MVYVFDELPAGELSVLHEKPGDASGEFHPAAQHGRDDVPARGQRQ
ncbi:MAG: hypothetical protein U1F42_03705 [Candidatus Competibacteraceae bacterium]